MFLVNNGFLYRRLSYNGSSYNGYSLIIDMECVHRVRSIGYNGYSLIFHNGYSMRNPSIITTIIIVA